jgi:hypothetical protein
MIRKSITLFFILIANFVLLAHAIIPHHHHQNEVYIVGSTYDTNSEIHKHGANECEHDHKNENEADDCSLNQIVVVRANQIRHEIKFIDCADNSTQLKGIQAVLFDNGGRLFLLNVSTINPPILPSIYSDFVGTLVCLRGPPLV